jgi:hypothetical protein
MTDADIRNLHLKSHASHGPNDRVDGQSAERASHPEGYALCPTCHRLGLPAAGIADQSSVGPAIFGLKYS